MSHNVPDLSEKQHQAIELLSTGKNFSDIAALLAIDRRTLWRWRQLPAFQLAHAEQKAALRGEMQERVQNIMRLSLVAIERNLANAEKSEYLNPLETALHILKLASLPALLQPNNNDDDN